MLPSKILALWATPRSRSTAFGRMMAQRGDFATVHEPFQGCAYSSDERLFDRWEPVPGTLGYADTLAALVAISRQQPLFIKDHAYYVEHLAGPEFLSHFEHTFLIRHPRAALPSYHRHWPDVTLAEAGYLAQAAVFDAVVRETGTIPAVVDADDLVANPEGAVRAYCQRVGIPFLRKALEWENGAPNESPWHAHLATTSGFEERTQRPYASVEDDPHLASLYADCLPAYEHLHRHRIRIDGTPIVPGRTSDPGKSSPAAS